MTDSTCLTLNVLLSFAQFEREVTAERIRDKIAASKKKGLWMGGAVPLGYDPHPDPLQRELVANPSEATTVQTLFQLYLKLGSLREVEERAKTLGLTSKLRVSSKGKHSGGRVLSRGQIIMVDIRPPVFPIWPLTRVRFESAPFRAVLNLLLNTPTQVRVMQEWRVFSDYQKLGIALPDTVLVHQNSPTQTCPEA